MLLATINSGTLIIALPDLEKALHTSILSLVWVILAYMIASTVLVLFSGRLSDLFGRKQAYVAGFVVFALASLGAGFATDGTQLILWRVLQGLGGAFLFANSAALVTDAFPREQLGLAMGTNTMVAAIGLVIGPVLGGALVAISWEWVFWFNVPLALLGSLWAFFVLRELARPDRVRGYDIPGVLVFVAGLTGLVFGLSRGGLNGWSDPLTIAGIVAGLVLLPLFVLIEKRSRAPMLDLTIFENRLFAASTAAAFINGLSRFALMFLFVFYFQGVKGQDPITAGIELAPMAIGMLISSPLAGIWADRHGSRIMSAAGMFVTAVALAGMTTAGRAHAVLLVGAVAVRRRPRLGHVQQPEHGGDDGHRADEPARDRRRRADDAAEHRRRDLDRVRARRSSPPRWPRTRCSRSSRASRRGSRTRRWSRSSRTCTRRSGCWRPRRWWAPRSACCGRGATEGLDADRRACARGGDDPADRALLRGDRAAAGGRRRVRPARIASTAPPISSS